MNAKNINVQDMNSLIPQPFKFHLGLREEKARPNVFFWININLPKHYHRKLEGGLFKICLIVGFLAHLFLEIDISQSISVGITDNYLIDLVNFLILTLCTADKLVCLFVSKQRGKNIVLCHPIDDTAH